MFREGAPVPRISLYLATAADLVSAAVGSDPTHWPVVYHDAMLSRVLGRALAHEIGHYLLNEREHSRSGLMRAVHPITDLMALRDTSLALSPSDMLVCTIRSGISTRTNPMVLVDGGFDRFLAATVFD